MRTPNRALAVGLALAMFLAACGDDDADDATDDTTTTAPDDTGDDTGDDAGDDIQGEPSMVEVTVTEDGVELSSDSIEGGVVEVRYTNETAGDADIDFSHVVDGTTEKEFVEGFIPVFEGGPFPDFAIDNAGFGAGPGETVTSTITLDAGEYIVWSTPEAPEDESGAEGDDGATDDPAAEAESDTAAGDDGEGEGGEDDSTSPEDFLTTTLTVTEPETEVAFPDTAGTITAKDYGFEIDAAGPGTYTFSNSGPLQFHHAVVVDFGTNDVDMIREKFPEILQSDDDAPPPEGIDTSQVDFDFASSGVFGPDGMGTFEADFESGNTYAVVCFISDRTGGPPHAIAYDMFEVFQAG